MNIEEGSIISTIKRIRNNILAYPNHLAIKALSRAFNKDNSYAMGWLDNMAVTFQDEGGGHRQSNLAAARFMKLAFDVDLLYIVNKRHVQKVTKDTQHV